MEGWAKQNLRYFSEFEVFSGGPVCSHLYCRLYGRMLAAQRDEALRYSCEVCRNANDTLGQSLCAESERVLQYKCEVYCSTSQCFFESSRYRGF